MAAVKTKLGRVPCPCCGHSVMLKENEAGTLTIACDECDVNAWAKKHTEAARRWRSLLPKAPEPAPEKVPEPAPPPPAATVPGKVPGKVPTRPAPPPPPKPKPSPFSILGSL